MAKRTSYQQAAIKNYYDNRDAIMLQRLGDLLTDLYLAEGKARKRIWDRAAASLEKLGVRPERIAAIVADDNPSQLANLYKELLGKV